MLLLLLASYIVGSLPFGLWLGLLLKRVDVREEGSGNIGASNVARVLGWQYGLIALVLDVGKGLLPVLTARHYGPILIPYVYPQYTLDTNSLVPGERASLIVGCGLAAIIGHNFSPFLKFKGGKGVATSLGVCIGMSWKAALAGAGTWAVLLALTRMISVGSLIGVPVGAFFIWVNNGKSMPFAVFGILAVVFATVKHRSNIQRIRNGTELKFSFKK